VDCDIVPIFCVSHWMRGWEMMVLIMMLEDANACSDFLLQ